MAAKPAHQWPDDDALVEIVGAHPTNELAAVAMGVNSRTLASHLGKRGLRDRVREHRIKAIEQNTPPAVDDPQRIRIIQLEGELKATKQRLNEVDEALASQEKFFAQMVDAARIPVEIRKPKARPARSKTLPKRSVVLPIFDLQYGQLVRSADTPHGRGVYSTSIFDERLARYEEAVCKSIADYATSHRLDEAVIALGGDFVEGDDIFGGQAWQLEIDPIRQSLELARKLAPTLARIVRFLREECGVRYVLSVGVPGNHGKVGGKKKGATPSSYSWDVLVLELLRDLLRGEQIDEWGIEPAGTVLFSCAGHVFQMVHGDEIKGWGGLPFYGLTRYDGRSMRLGQHIYRYLLLGHHHQPATIPNGSGEHIVSGDWVGANNLSRFLAAASRPQQRILFVADKWGVTEDARIYLSTAEEAYEPAHVYNQHPPVAA